MIILFYWCFCFVLFRISYLLIPIYIYLQGVSVEAVDPVFQAKMLDMLKQTGRWFIFPHYINIILCSGMHQKPKFKPSLNLHFVKVLKHKIWPSRRDQCMQLYVNAHFFKFIQRLKSWNHFTWLYTVPQKINVWFLAFQWSKFRIIPLRCFDIVFPSYNIHCFDVMLIFPD